MAVDGSDSRCYVPSTGSAGCARVILVVGYGLENC